MCREKERIQVRVDAYTRVCLTAIAILLTVLVIGLWTEMPGPTKPVQADPAASKVFLDSSAQRKSMIEHQKETNSKLSEIATLLRSGNVKVQVVGAPQEAAKKDGSAQIEVP